MRLPRPIVYQHTRGGRRRIAARYTDRGASEVGFAVAPYDRRAPLIIDPLVIIYSTFLGGGLPSPGINSDSVYGIAVNESAFAYVTGSTTSTDFPDDASSTFGGLQDAFVAKLAQGGSALVYSTFLGASFSQP